MKAYQHFFAMSFSIVLSGCGDIRAIALDARHAAWRSDALMVGNLTVFDDAAVNSFTNTSWGACSINSTAYVHSGTYAASLSTSNWDGLQFNHPGFASRDYSAITFWVNGGAASGQKLWAGVTDLKRQQYRKSIATYLHDGQIMANQWQQVTLPLVDIGAANIEIASVYVMAGAAGTQPTVYLDDIALTTAADAGATTGGDRRGPGGGEGEGTPEHGGNTGHGSTTGHGNTTGGQATAGGGTPGAGSTATTGGAATGATSTTGGSTTGTTSTTGGSTTGAVTTGGSAGSGVARESWAWVYTNWQVSLNSIAGNAKSFTHISPTFYSLNYDYTSGAAAYSNCTVSAGSYDCTNTGTNNFGGLTTQQFTKQVAALNLVTVPAIYAGAANGGSDVGVQNILNNTGGAGTKFVAAMVQEAVSNGYAGYNLDWEMGAGVDGTYADKFVSFVNNFKQALGPYGMSLSVDAIVSNINGTWCSSNNGYLDFAKLSKCAIDRVMIENYTSFLGTAYTACQPVTLSSASPAQCPLSADSSSVAATGLLNYMCSNLPADKVVIGLESYSSGNNPIAGQLLSSMQSYGLRKVAVWPQLEGNYSFLSAQGLVASEPDWYSLLAKFVTD